MNSQELVTAAHEYASAQWRADRAFRDGRRIDYLQARIQSGAILGRVRDAMSLPGTDEAADLLREVSRRIKQT